VLCGAVNLAPVFYVIGMLERPSLLLIGGLLTMIIMVFMTSPISCVDLLIFLLLRGPLATGLKESSLGLGSLYAYVCDCEQIGHSLGLLHGNLLHGLEIADPVMKGIDDLDVLDIRDSVPSIAETFDIVPETLIMLLPDGFQGLSTRWMFIHALKFPMNMAHSWSQELLDPLVQVDEP
jgi:hypothetical protein